MQKTDGTQDTCQQLLADLRKLGAICSGRSEPLMLQRLLQISQRSVLAIVRTVFCCNDAVDSMFGINCLTDYDRCKETR